MNNWDKIESGKRIEIGLLQIDIVGHSKFKDNDRDIQKIKVLFREIVEGIVKIRGGRLLNWSGDGGCFMFLIDTGGGFFDLAFSAIQILNNLPFINEEAIIRFDFSEAISVRISGDSGIVVYDKDPSQISGDFMNTFLKYEREIGITNAVSITERVWNQLNNSLKKIFNPLQYSEHVKSQIYNYSGKSSIQILPEINRYQAINNRIEKCKKGEEVKFIAITGLGAMLSGPWPDKRGQPLLDRPFPKALSKGVKFKGIVLNPNSTEAKFRSNVESPGTPIKRRLLQKDACAVKNDLWWMYKESGIEEDNIQNLELKYTNIGIAFSLWMFDDIAFIEPIHYAKKEGDPHLCGDLCQLKINRRDLNTSDFPKKLSEYQIIEKHFQVLWDNSEKISLEKR